MNGPLTEVRLGDVAEVAAGQAAPQGAECFGGDGRPFIRAGSLEALVGNAKEGTLETVSASVAAKHRLRLFPAGTVVFAKSGMSATRGLVHMLVEPAYVVSHLAAVIPGGELDPSYLKRWLETHPPGHLINDSAYPSIRLADIADLRVPLPTLVEQSRTVSMLDKTDAIRRKRRASLGLLDEFLRSKFIELFGDAVRNERGWPSVSLGELLQERSLIVDGPFGSSLKPESYVDSGVRVIRNFNIKDDDFDDSAFKFITESKFEEVKRSEVWPGDVLISTKGTLGNVCLMPHLPGRSVLSATGTVRLRLPNEAVLRRQFLVSQATTSQYKRYIKKFEAGTNQKYLVLADIRRLEVILPSIELQDRYCLLRGRVVSLRDQQTRALACSEELFHSLAQGAFDAGGLA